MGRKNTKTKKTEDLVLRCHPGENRLVSNSHGLYKHRCAGWDGGGGWYGFGVDACAVGVHHIILPVEGSVAGEGVAHQVPALADVEGIIDQFDFAVADVGPAVEGEGDRVRVGVEVALAGFEHEGTVSFEVLPFVAFVRRVEAVEVVMVCGVGNEVADDGGIDGVKHRRGDEVPVAIFRAVAGDILGDCDGFDIGSQYFASDGIDLVGVERAADDDLSASVVFVIEELAAFDRDGACVGLVATSVDVVVCIGPAEGDVALGVYFIGLHLAAVDDNVAIAREAGKPRIVLGIDTSNGAAVDGQVVVDRDAKYSGAGIEATAVEGEAAGLDACLIIWAANGDITAVLDVGHLCNAIISSAIEVEGASLDRVETLAIDC